MKITSKLNKTKFVGAERWYNPIIRQRRWYKIKVIYTFVYDEYVRLLTGAGCGWERVKVEGWQGEAYVRYLGGKVGKFAHCRCLDIVVWINRPDFGIDNWTTSGWGMKRSIKTRNLLKELTSLKFFDFSVIWSQKETEMMVFITFLKRFSLLEIQLKK